ncbi:MAG: polysaccharide biosynthesis protein, partial [Bacillota bacterium]|nr:polysaccharide biosynthesis protein [Bacillota bacterium]
MKKQSFFLGAIILVIASFINRIIGFVYRILAVRLVGAEGIGLYEMVFPVYIMVLVLATAGFPLAISRLVSVQMAKNNIAAAYKIFKVSLFFLFCSGLFFSFALYYLLPYLLDFAFQDDRVYLIFKTMIPAIFIISVSSAFRGFFQGLHQMWPTALTQTIEQLVRVFIGLSLAVYLIPRGIEYGVVGLAVGMVMGEVIGLAFIVLIYLKKRPVYVPGGENISLFYILKDIHHLSVPITITKTFATVILAIEAMLLPKRLAVAGLSLREATTVYGQYSGMALSLLVLPTILTISLAVTLVPAIAEAHAQRNRYAISTRVHNSIKLTILVGIPSSIVFYCFGPEITSLLFNNQDSGYMLRILALGGIFLYLQQTTSGILQGLGEVRAILQNTLIGGLVRLGGIYYLT